MAILNTGSASGSMKIDSVAYAARVSQYDLLGVYCGPKVTYRAATAPTVVAVTASTVPFFVISGSGSKTIVVQRITVSGGTLTAVEYANIQVNKHSTAFSGGTATALTQIPVDSTSGAGTATLCQVYTAAPTAGTSLGVIDVQRVLLQSTTAAASGLPFLSCFDFRQIGEAKGVVLNGASQGLSISVGTALASAATYSLSIEWVEF